MQFPNPLPCAILCLAAASAPTTSGTSAPAARETTPLSAQFAAIAKRIPGRVGAVAALVETPGPTASLRPDEHFPMQSVYKLPIAMATLRHAERGKLPLEQTVHLAPSDLVPKPNHSPIRDRNPGNGGVELTVRELLRAALVESDGSASDALLRLVGGPDAVNRYLAEIGIAATVHLATTEAEMARDDTAQYRNWATPAGIVALLRHIQSGDGLSPENRRLLLDWMAETPTGPKRIKGRLPENTPVAHKTGSSGTRDDGITPATNDVGLITLPDGNHVAVAVFVADSFADTDEREQVIADIARAAYDAWAKQPSHPDRPPHAPSEPPSPDVAPSPAGVR